DRSNGWSVRRELPVDFGEKGVYSSYTQVSRDLGFPVAYGMTRADGDAMGAWWEQRRDHIQPSEFVLTQTGKVMMSTYSNSPIGRMDPAEALTLIRFLNAQRAKAKKD
ncbi:MAG: hypothetical protein O3A73_14495, partial [Proteobacteria bacterium]|nr:hypothetical protein [Pseudomonadota bacterium]